MDALTLRQELERCGVVLVVRLGSADHLDDLVRSAVRAGIKIVEITTTIPGGLDWLANAAGTQDLSLGVGTVVDTSHVRAAVSAGADFLVSPNVDARVLEESAEAGVACMPGALTPTEVATALGLGAAAVKLFPVTQLGPGYLRDLRGPLPDAPLVPIGGIDARNAAEYIRAGATAIGVGAAFVNDAVVADGDWATLSKRLATLVHRVNEARTPTAASGDRGAEQ